MSELGNWSLNCETKGMKCGYKMKITTLITDITLTPGGGGV